MHRAAGWGWFPKCRDKEVTEVGHVVLSSCSPNEVSVMAPVLLLSGVLSQAREETYGRGGFNRGVWGQWVSGRGTEGEREQARARKGMHGGPGCQRRRSLE